PARVAVTTFASNVARLCAVARAAAACEREVVIIGRAMERIAQVARETGYLDGIQDFRSVEVYGHLPPDKVVALCTGSQGEPRAAPASIRWFFAGTANSSVSHPARRGRSTKCRRDGSIETAPSSSAQKSAP